jgi:glycosyltransferase involved in cell wall biosynthesis
MAPEEVLKSMKANGPAGSSPVVSVIMNCFNAEKYLREALDSVFSQTYEDWEIIFWEDADSSDSSGAIAKSYGGKLRHFKAEEKLPLYGARNRAIKMARGEYLAILDCDDIWLPTKLEEQMALFKEDEEVGLVYSDCILFNEKGREKRFFNIVRPERGMVFEKLLFSNFINTQTVVIKKSTFDSFDNMFDGRLHMSGDYDAYLRMSHKWKFDYVDRPLARYRVHSGSMTSKDGRRLQAEEIGVTIENLKSEIPEFEVRFPEGFRHMERRRDIQIVLLDWEAGKKGSARNAVNPYIFDNIHLFGLFILMFFPYRFVFKPFYKFYNKNPLSDLI